MSKGPENRFIASVHRLLPSDLYWMKNHNAYIGGPADVWYSGTKKDIWIEYKYVEKLPSIVDLTDQKKKYCLSMLQQEWLNNRLKEGRDVYVVLGTKEYCFIFTNGAWMVEHTRKHLMQPLKPRTRQMVAEWIAIKTKGTYEAPVRRSKKFERCV